MLLHAYSGELPLKEIKEALDERNLGLTPKTFATTRSLESMEHWIQLLDGEDSDWCKESSVPGDTTSDKAVDSQENRDHTAIDVVDSDAMPGEISRYISKTKFATHLQNSEKDENGKNKNSGNTASPRLPPSIAIQDGVEPWTFKAFSRIHLVRSGDSAQNNVKYELLTSGQYLEKEKQRLDGFKRLSIVRRQRSNVEKKDVLGANVPFKPDEFVGAAHADDISVEINKSFSNHLENEEPKTEPTSQQLPTLRSSKDIKSLHICAEGNLSFLVLTTEQEIWTSFCGSNDIGDLMADSRFVMTPFIANPARLKNDPLYKWKMFWLVLGQKILGLGILLIRGVVTFTIAVIFMKWASDFIEWWLNTTQGVPLVHSGFLREAITRC